MARTFPFRGYRYDPERVGKVEDVVTQPYDKITPEMLQSYLQRHPENIARVTKNSNYQEAGRYLNHWIHEGILKQDPAPSFYPYEKVFEFDGQTYSCLGFIGLVSLEDAELAVKGHEKIHQEPLEDRLNLMRETESNQGLIFMLYSDPSMEAAQLLSESAQDLPVAIEVVDEYQVIHRVWVLNDLKRQEQISAALKDKPFYIADGHHRFQTSVLYCKECLNKGWKPIALESFDKRVVALFDMDDPALKILPTHRAIRKLSTFYLAEVLSNLENFFDIEKVTTLSELDHAMGNPRPTIGLAAGQPDRIYALRLKEAAEKDPAFMPGITGPARTLDVNILHEGILKPFLRIGEEELSKQTHVDYYRSKEELVGRLHEGQYQAAFILNPTRPEQVRQISERGEKVPQKSTDFYPKLLTGLVLMKMEMLKGNAKL